MIQSGSQNTFAGLITSNTISPHDFRPSLLSWPYTPFVLITSHAVSVLVTSHTICHMTPPAISVLITSQAIFYPRECDHTHHILSSEPRTPLHLPVIDTLHRVYMTVHLVSRTYFMTSRTFSLPFLVQYISFGPSPWPNPIPFTWFITLRLSCFFIKIRRLVCMEVM